MSILNIIESISTIFDGRVYPVVAPPYYTLPCASVIQISSDPEVTRDELLPGGELIQVSIFGKDLRSLEGLALLVEGRIRTLRSGVIQNQRTSVDPNEVFSIHQDYRF